MKDFRVTRYNDSKVWVSVCLDPVIKQTLMRSVKSISGLTRGTNFAVGQQNTFLFLKPAFAEIIYKMQIL